MGDRALIQLESTEGLSPALYLHWSGRHVPELLDGLAQQMKSRGPDLPYWTARMIGRACNMNGGDSECMSVGVWDQDEVLTIKNSMGDAGVFVLNIDTNTVRYGGGYTPNIASDSPLTWTQMPTAYAAA